MVVTGDFLQVERKFRDPFSFRNRAKLIFSANELPGTRDRSSAFFRRWIVVPFLRQFHKGMPSFDPLLLEKLTSPEGRSYLLRLAVEGLRRLDARGHFSDSKTTADARAEYRRDADTIVAWFQELCSFDPEAWTSNATAYTSYREWCARGGHAPADISILARRMRALEPRLKSVRRTEANSRVRGWSGLIVAGMAGIDPGPSYRASDDSMSTEGGTCRGTSGPPDTPDGGVNHRRGQVPAAAPPGWSE